MAMILQVIFAVCCFIEIISPLAILPNKTEREVARFNKSLSDLCDSKVVKRSDELCGYVPIIKLLTNQNKSEMCSDYKHEFGKIHCALENITYNNCSNNHTIQELLKRSKILSDGSHNVTCDAGKSYMQKFCNNVQLYIRTFKDECEK